MDLYNIAEKTRTDAYPPHAFAMFNDMLQKPVKIVAEGDSWFSYFPAYDIIAQLRGGTWGRSYDIAGKPKAGSYLNDMVYHPRQLAETFQAIHEHKPQIFLFSGGGNDIAGDELFGFLWNKLSRHPEANNVLNRQVVSAIIDQVFRQAYIDFVTAVRQCARDAGISKLPFVCHGYAYPIPDGRGWAGGWGVLPGPWLDPSLSRKNWDREQDQAVRLAAISRLIDALNDMLGSLSKDIEDFHYVDVRNALQPTKEFWGNELHPTQKGFEVVTVLIEKKLQQLVL